MGVPDKMFVFLVPSQLLPGSVFQLPFFFFFLYSLEQENGSTKAIPVLWPPKPVSDISLMLFLVFLKPASGCVTNYALCFWFWLAVFLEEKVSRKERILKLRGKVWVGERPIKEAVILSFSRNTQRTILFLPTKGLLYKFVSQPLVCAWLSVSGGCWTNCLFPAQQLEQLSLLGGVEKQIACLKP